MIYRYKQEVHSQNSHDEDARTNKTNSYSLCDFLFSFNPIGRNQHNIVSVFFVWPSFILATIALGSAIDLTHIWSKILSLILFFHFFCFSTIFHVRRLNDIGWSGRYVLLLFLPIVQIPFFVFLCTCPTNRNQNKYGRQSNSLTKKQYFILSIPVIVLLMLGVALILN